MAVVMQTKSKIELMKHCPFTIRDTLEMMQINIWEMHTEVKRAAVLAVHAAIAHEWAKAVLTETWEE